jgi:hypothetical protein
MLAAGNAVVFNAKGIRILVVTGGPGVVKAALASGKRAICAGPGNPPVVVDETALVEKAGRDVARGHSFDNNVICTDEKEVFVVASVAERFKKAVAAAGGELKSQERLPIDFREVREPGRASSRRCRQERGRHPGCHGYGGSNARLLFRGGEGAPAGLTEQMMPVLPIVRIRRRRGIDCRKVMASSHRPCTF